MAMQFCTECGKKMSDQATSCPFCGCPNANCAGNVGTSQRSVVVYLILCWLLGVFGAHRYYAGKIGSAVVMTILTLTIFGVLITCIWALVDLIVGLCYINKPQNLFAK